MKEMIRTRYRVKKKEKRKIRGKNNKKLNYSKFEMGGGLI